MKISEDELTGLARKYSLLNAIEHDGRAAIGSVVGRILAENADLRQDAQRVRSICSAKVAEANLLTIQEQRNALDEEFPGEMEKHLEKKKQISKSDSEKIHKLPDLPEAKEGLVTTRFPPEPNGFMHIGHAKAAIVGFEYAKMYKGKFVLRFDDTNPAAEKKEYYTAFLEALEWLRIVPTSVKSASDDMQKFYEIAEKLLEISRAYVCKCPQEIMRKNRGLGVACSHRMQTIEQNLSLWNDMLSGKALENSATLRFAGEMQSQNSTMRDPVLFRIVEDSHPLKGKEYHVWPTYDFDGPVEDSLDGVTHAMRSKEYELRDELYRSILDALNMRKPEIIEFSRLELQNSTVSKRSLRKLIEDGSVAGWDDPRLPTIAGLRRRGFLPEAIHEFVMSMGVSKVESQPTWDLLESINRRILDPITKRFFFVEMPVSLDVENAPHLQVSLKFHPDRDYGERKIDTNGKFLISESDALSLAVGMKIRLIEAYNIQVLSIDARGIKARYQPGEISGRVSKIQWVLPEENIPLRVEVTAPLLLDGKYNPGSLRHVNGVIESSAKDLRVGEAFQLVRFGFCRLDSLGIAIMTHK